MPKLLLATNNEGKAREYRELLTDCGWELVTLQELGIEPSTEETGNSYEENATMKALNGAKASGLVALADDSGLEIDALDGAPGPLSARFQGADASYQERFAEILERLQGLPPGRRWARFCCVIAIAEPEGDRIRLADGRCEGQIAQAPRGEGGFGYDPIFYLPERGLTMAELLPHEKNIISHRARAAWRARQILKELLYERQGRHSERSEESPGGPDPSLRSG